MEDPDCYRTFSSIDTPQGEPGCAGWGCRKCGRVSSHLTVCCPICKSSSCSEVECEGCGAARADGEHFSSPMARIDFMVRAEAEEESAADVIDAYCAEADAAWPKRKNVYGDDIDDPNERASEVAEVFASNTNRRLKEYGVLFDDPPMGVELPIADALAWLDLPSEGVAVPPIEKPTPRRHGARQLIVRILKAVVEILEES